MAGKSTRSWNLRVWWQKKRHGWSHQIWKCLKCHLPSSDIGVILKWFYTWLNLIVKVPKLISSNFDGFVKSTIFCGDVVSGRYHFNLQPIHPIEPIATLFWVFLLSFTVNMFEHLKLTNLKYSQFWTWKTFHECISTWTTLPDYVLVSRGENIIVGGDIAHHRFSDMSSISWPGKFHQTYTIFAPKFPGLSFPLYKNIQQCCPPKKWAGILYQKSTKQFRTKSPQSPNMRTQNCDFQGKTTWNSVGFQTFSTAPMRELAPVDNIFLTTCWPPRHTLQTVQYSNTK